jgi:hypothetical protein
MCCCTGDTTDTEGCSLCALLIVVCARFSLWNGGVESLCDWSFDDTDFGLIGDDRGDDSLLSCDKSDTEYALYGRGESLVWLSKLRLCGEADVDEEDDWSWIEVDFMRTTVIF